MQVTLFGTEHTKSSAGLPIAIMSTLSCKYVAFCKMFVQK